MNRTKGRWANAGLRPLAAVLLCLAMATGAAQAGDDVAEKPRDITGIEELPPVPPPVRWPYWLGLAVVASAGLAFAGWKLARRRARPALVSPDRWAQEELDRVAALGLPDAGQTERYHVLISDVIRRYLDLRYDLRAPRQTTAEFLHSVREQSPLPPERQEKLAEFLRRCDVAKFAPVVPPLDECREALELARGVVADGHAT